MVDIDGVWTPRSWRARDRPRPVRSRASARHRGMSFEIGDTVPSFTLTDTEGAEHAMPSETSYEATVVILMCNHCPFVQAWNSRIAAVAKDYTPRGVRFLAINSNDAERFPADS